MRPGISMPSAICLVFDLSEINREELRWRRRAEPQIRGEIGGVHAISHEFSCQSKLKAG